MLSLHPRTNVVIRDLVEIHSDFRIECRLETILRNLGMTVTELSRLTGIRPATITDIMHLKRTTVSLVHILVIAKTLKLTDMNQLIRITMDDDTKDLFELERSVMENLGVTEEMVAIMEFNDDRLNREEPLHKYKSKKKPSLGF